MTQKEAYDYIVIGAGSAGCVLANRLSADPKRLVLLIEAGGRDRHPLVQLPMLMGKLMHSRIYNWHYETEPEPELEGRRVSWPRGKALGGSSTINGMIYVRGNRHDYDRWSQMGLPGWSYEEVLPYFRKSEGHVQRRDAFHGAEGPLTVCRARGKNALFDMFVAAGRQAGYLLNDDFNGAEQEGFGRYDFTIRNGKRCSTSKAFLRPILDRPNLTIATHALTHRIIVENNRAVAVDFAVAGQSRRARAKREIVLSAGAVNSPQLLMLSGIGDADELTEHGIDVVRDLPGVGKNLQDHVDVCVVFQINQPMTLHSDLRVDRLTASILRGFLFGEGVATTFPRGDMISQLLASAFEGAKTSFEEVCDLVRMVIFGGMDTVVAALGNIFLQLDRHPDIRARLIADRDLLTTAIEEFLRYDAPIQGFARRATKNARVGAESVRAGETVFMVWASANRDERIFGPNSETLQIDRAPNRHLTFGIGGHRCQGAPLARAELRIVLDRLLTRIPDFEVCWERVVGPETIGSSYGQRAVPVVFTPRQSA